MTEWRLNNKINWYDLVLPITSLEKNTKIIKCALPSDKYSHNLPNVLVCSICCYGMKKKVKGLHFSSARFHFVKNFYLFKSKLGCHHRKQWAITYAQTSWITFCSQLPKVITRIEWMGLLLWVNITEQPYWWHGMNIKCGKVHADSGKTKIFLKVSGSAK